MVNVDGRVRVAVVVRLARIVAAGSRKSISTRGEGALVLFTVTRRGLSILSECHAVGSVVDVAGIR